MELNKFESAKNVVLSFHLNCNEWTTNAANKYKVKPRELHSVQFEMSPKEVLIPNCVVYCREKKKGLFFLIIYDWMIYGF